MASSLYAMADVPRKKTLEELREEAITELERRGYEVRGKTPAQIRELLRGHSKKRNSKATRTSWRTDDRD